MSVRVRFPISLGVGLLALCAAPPAVAQTEPSPTTDRASCLTSHTRAQELRIESKLLEARSELRQCSAEICPGVIKNDCAGWLSEVEQQIPSVTLAAKVEGASATEVRVSIDGRVLTETLDGTAYELDPGAHNVRFEVDGYPPEEQIVVLRQYEKRHVLSADFRTTPAAAPTPPPVMPSAPRPEPPARTSRPIPIAVWMLGGFALGAAGASAYLGVDALSTYSDRDETCSPNCSDSDVRQLKGQLLLADIAGGAALVSAGLAAYLFLTRPVVSERAPAGWTSQIRVSLATRGAGLAVGTAF